MLQRIHFKITCTLSVVCVATALPVFAQSFRSLSFHGTNGRSPNAPLVQGTDGNFYGTTELGGNHGNNGTVFRITPNGVITTIYNFCSLPSCADGRQPITGLTLATDGNFYGTTMSGGQNDAGSVFRISSGGTLTTLYSFSSSPGTDGFSPGGALLQAADRNLYGTTQYGGTAGNGTVYRITLRGSFTALASFTDEAFAGTLVQDWNGNFYGPSYSGGEDCGLEEGGCGTLFQMTSSGTLSDLYLFPLDCAGSCNPSARLSPAIDGNLYGTTNDGGAHQSGTIFKVTPSGALTTLYNFCTEANCLDGTMPDAPILATDGSVYSTAREGGAAGYGDVFSFDTGGTLHVLHSFCTQAGCPDGQTAATGGLLEATTGSIYGVATLGGDLTCGNAAGCGTVFSISTGLPAFVAFVNGSARVGQTVGILGQGFNGTTSVSFNGTAANFVIQSRTLILATVPAGAATGSVTVATPSGTLTSNVPFRVIP